MINKLVHKGLLPVILIMFGLLLSSKEASAESSFDIFFKKYPLEYWGSPYGDQIDREEAKDFPPYFISPKYKKNVEAALATLNLQGEQNTKLKEFKFRELSLGMNYEEVMAFAKKEGMTCQSRLSHFCSVGEVLGIEDDLSPTSDKISQTYILCKSDDGFSFSPLGRLTNFSIHFWSEEEPIPVMKQLEQKLPKAKWTYQHSDRVGNSYYTGRMFHQDGEGQNYTLKITLEYFHGNSQNKKFVNGKFIYGYVVNASSHYIEEQDVKALQNILIKNTPKTPTRM